MLFRFRRLLERFSLAARITALIVFVMTLGLTIAGVGTMSVLRDSLVTSLDRDLEGSLQTLNEVKIDLNSAADRCSFDQRVPNAYYLAIVLADGTPLCSNKPALPGYPDTSSINLATAGRTDHAVTLPSVNGDYQWRVVMMPLRVERTSQYVVLVLGVGLESTSNVWRSFAVIFSGFSILAIVLGAAFTRILAVGALRGLRRVADAAGEFAAGDYSTRLTPEDPRTEVGSLKESLNTMLGQIDAAIEARDESVKQMRQFVGDASHELRTPLVTVRGYAELYRMGALQQPEDMGSAMERIEREAIRMGRLVEDLLTLARLDERRPLRLQPLDLTPLVNDAANDLRASQHERSVTVFSIDADALDGADCPDAHKRHPKVFAPPPLMPPAVVLADEHSIRQVLANLLSNAVRYTPAGSPLELGVGVSWRRREAVVHVIDHGEGIPAELREKIFQRFYRADKSRTRETGGSGLGLAIVEGILLAHHARIDVVETNGGGATFRITMPLADDTALGELASRIRPEQVTTGRSYPQRQQSAP